MSIPQIILLVWLAFSGLVNIMTIGKKREPLTPGAAALSMVILAGLAYLVVIA